MTILLKTIYRFNSIPYQITKVTFQRIRAKHFTICMKIQKTQIAKTILRKKNKGGGIKLPDFRLYYKATVIKTVWYWHKNRNMDQWNRMESPEIHPHTYGYLIYDKIGKNIKWSKDNFFNKQWWLKLESHMQKNETRILHNTIHKNKVKMD